MRQKLHNLFMSWVLFVVALILAAIIFPLGIIFVAYRSVFYYNKSTPLGYITYVGKALACAIDLIGNVIAGPLLNRWFLKPESDIYFGDIDHYISLIMAFNYRKDWLSKDAMVVYNTIEYFDPGHFENTITNFENKVIRTRKYFG